MATTTMDHFLAMTIKDFNFNDAYHRLLLTLDRNRFYTHFDINSGHATVLGAFCNNGNFHYSISICAPCDNFSKKVGRELCNDRIINGNSKMRGIIFAAIIDGKSQWASRSEIALFALINHLTNLAKRKTSNSVIPKWLESSFNNNEQLFNVRIRGNKKSMNNNNNNNNDDDDDSNGNGR